MLPSRVNLPLHHQLVHIDRPFTRYGRAMRARRQADQIVYAEIARRRVARASASSDRRDHDVLGEASPPLTVLGE